MQREYRWSGYVVRLQRILVRLMFGIGVLTLVTSGFYENDSDRWGSVGGAAFIFLVALGFYIAMNRIQPTVVEVHAEGLRYGHRPGSTLVPWARIRGVHEQHLAQRLDLIDAEGELCFSLEYCLEDFAELRDLVLEHVPIALQTPVRFRRSWGWDGLLITLALLVLSGTAIMNIWWACAGVMACGFLLREESKSPYAAQVTDSELVLSFTFRTLTIPLQELKFSSATQCHQGAVLQLLQVEDPGPKKAILIRNVGVDMIVLKATLEEAIRLRPLATFVSAMHR